MKSLNRYMKKNNLNSRQFAQELRIPPITVYSWKTGRSRPRLELALLIDKITKGEVSVYDWMEK